MGVEYDVYHNEVYLIFDLNCENFMELSNYYDNDVDIYVPGKYPL